MDYRFTADELMRTLDAWDAVLPGRRKVRLIACGGTALTLLGCKESTKDVDFLVPVEKEYKRLTQFLAQAGYERISGYGWKRVDENIIFDLYAGKTVYQTELLTSPLARGGTRLPMTACCGSTDIARGQFDDRLSKLVVQKNL